MAFRPSFGLTPGYLMGRFVASPRTFLTPSASIDARNPCARPSPQKLGSRHPGGPDRTCYVTTSLSGRRSSVVLDDLTSDRFIWRWTADGSYSASSAYRAFFFGMASLRGTMELWKARALGKCKFFFWLLLHDRLWTAVRRKQHGLQNEDGCTLCDQEQATPRRSGSGCWRPSASQA
jgi:hypothetical protein